MGVFKLVVGLGNPGSEYERTRHNAGFMVVDELARRLKAGKFKKTFKGRYVEAECPDCNATVGLLEPLTFMNRSGASVQAALKQRNSTPADVIVVHDDVDLPLGRIRVKVGGGTGGHKGIESVKGLIGADFIRVRVGVDRPGGRDTAEHVLDRFRMDEEAIITNESIPRAVEAILEIIVHGPERAMNAFNRL